MRSTISNLAHLPYHKQSVSPEKSGKSEYKKTLSPASFSRLVRLLQCKVVKYNTEVTICPS